MKQLFQNSTLVELICFKPYHAQISDLADLIMQFCNTKHKHAGRSSILIWETHGTGILTH